MLKALQNVLKFSINIGVTILYLKASATFLNTFEILREIVYCHFQYVRSQKVVLFK